MKNTIRNILALPVGIFIGGFFNMLLVTLGPNLIAPPEDSDLTTMEGLTEAMKHMEFKHFVFPFLGHALGTFVGAFLTAKIAFNNQFAQSIIVGALFFIGGSMMVYQLPSPLWFNVSDLALAYFPMAYLGYKIAHRK